MLAAGAHRNPARMREIVRQGKEIRREKDDSGDFRWLEWKKKEPATSSGRRATDFWPEIDRNRMAAARMHRQRPDDAKKKKRKKKGK